MKSQGLWLPVFVDLLLIGFKISRIDTAFVLRRFCWNGAASGIHCPDFFFPLIIGPAFIWWTHISSSADPVKPDVANIIRARLICPSDDVYRKPSQRHPAVEARAKGYV